MFLEDELSLEQQLPELARGAAGHRRVEVEFAVRLDQFLEIVVLDLVLRQRLFPSAHRKKRENTRALEEVKWAIFIISSRFLR